MHPALARLAAMAGGLKEVRRQGWVDRGVADAESVADHCYRLALMAWAAARLRGLDADRALLVALVHDLPEAEVGDETPFDSLLGAAGQFDRAAFDRAAPSDPERRAAKRARERRALERLAGELPEAVGAELRAAWLEYDAQQSDEARLVKELDRVETLLQAEAYATGQPGLPIGSFRIEVEGRPEATDLMGLFRG